MILLKRDEFFFLYFLNNIFTLMQYLVLNLKLYYTHSKTKYCIRAILILLYSAFN